MAKNDEFYFEGEQYFNPRLQLPASEKKTIVEQLLIDYRLSCAQIARLRTLLAKELEYGLQANPERPSLFPMVNTFVTTFPNGNEVGDFIGLDIGGSNLRIVYLKLTKVGDKYEKMIDVDFYEVSRDIRQSNVQKFFGHLASCVKEFFDKRNLYSIGKVLTLGFTFSFGYDQLAIDRGAIVQMGIQTDVEGAVGGDPVTLLQSAIDSLAVPVRIVALANDSTATLIYARYLDQQTTVGLILGSGTNIAYYEEVANFGKISNPVKTFGQGGVPEKFVVNSEFPLFGDNGCMDFAKTKYDFELDNNSLTPHIYTYEKITGGAYLGELFRLTLVDLARKGLLFSGGYLTEQLTAEGSIQSSTLSLIEAEFEQNGFKAEENTQAAALFVQLGYSTDQFGAEDCSIATYVAQLITVRSAIFIAAATSIFADHIKESVVKVGCDGSLFKKHPKMAKMINAYANAFSPNKKTEVFLADQGSGIGVAMIAATLSQSN